MTVSEIVDFLEDNGMSEIEELNYTKKFIALKFFYDFDKEELDAAKSYANEESDLDENSDLWYKEWYLPYLSDIAKDNVEEVVEELCEEFEILGSYKAVEFGMNNTDYIKYIAVFAEESLEKEIEDLLNDYL